MKFTTIIILVFGLFSCNNSTQKNIVENKATSDSLVSIDSLAFYIDESKINSNKYIEFYSCDFDKFLKDPKTPKLAKDIYLDKDWNLNNDTEALALLDSLTAIDKTSRPFYFKVVTKTINKADGYFSEGLGHEGYEFVKNHTQEFASNFDNKQCHTDNDLGIWADIVIMEFSLNGNGKFDKQKIENYIKKLKSNCKECTTTQKKSINKFGSTLKEKWIEFQTTAD